MAAEDARGSQFLRRPNFGHFYPDGGFGWCACLAAGLLSLLVHGLPFAFAVSAGRVLSHLAPAKSAPPVVLIGSLCIACSSVCSAVTAVLCRRRSVRLAAIVGSFLSVLAVMFMSFAETERQFLISTSLCFGSGSGVLTGACFVSVLRFFNENRGKALACLYLGSAFGIGIAANVFNVLLNRWNSRASLQIVAASMLVCFPLSAILRPASLYHPKRSIILHIRGLKKTKKQMEEFKSKLPYFDLNVFRMRLMQVFGLATFVASFGLFTPFLLLADFQPVGQNTTGPFVAARSAMLLAVLAAGSILGISFASFILLRKSFRCQIDRQYFMQFSLFGAGLSCFIRPLSLQVPMPFYVAYGFFFGSYIYSHSLILFEISRAKLAEPCWTAALLLQALPIAVGSPIADWLNRIYSHWYGWTFSGCSLAFGAILFGFLPLAAKSSSNYAVIQREHLRHVSVLQESIVHDVNLSQLNEESLNLTDNNSPTNDQHGHNGLQSRHANSKCSNSDSLINKMKDGQTTPPKISS